MKIYAFAATLVIAVLLLTAFQNSSKKKFTEIDVERLNIVQRDGKIKVVLSNNAKSSDVVVGRKTIVANRNECGIYFYNDLGEESGGLYTYGNIENGKPNAGIGLNFDQFQQDQTIGMFYGERNGRRRAGLFVQDRSDIPQPLWNEKYEAALKMPKGAERDAAMKPLLALYRVYVGKTDENSSAVLLYDKEGKTRVRLQVDEKGNPKLEFLDSNGKIIQSLPNNSQSRLRELTQPNNSAKSTTLL